jgi:hypothetical protein
MAEGGWVFAVNTCLVEESWKDGGLDHVEFFFIAG